MNDSIALEDHNPQWAGDFELERARILAALGHVTQGGIFENLHHVGSTSVPGLKARPVIDKSQGPLRGAKRMLWEGGHRVPFIAWGPGRVPSGATEKEIICLTDIMSTVASIVGVKLGNDTCEDSVDIGAALFGKKRAKPLREATVHHSMNNEYGLRQGDWVFIESEKSAHGAAEPEWWRERNGIQKHTEPGELFHLKEDLKETKNLYAQYPDRVKEMQALLEKYKEDGRSVPRR